MSADNKNRLFSCKSCSLPDNQEVWVNFENTCNFPLPRIDVSGTWTTGWKGAPVKMVLSQDGNVVTGTYEFNNGKVIGTLNGNIMEGSWTEVDNSGLFRFNFFNDGNSFDGTWGFGKDISGGGIWYGRKLLEEKVNVTGTWDTNYARLYLEQKSSTVVGRYDKNNGILEGVLEGNILIGDWYESRFKLGSFDTNGNFRLTFSPNNTFTGSRGLNESFTNEGVWTGKKVGTLSEFANQIETIDTTGTWNTNFNLMTLRQTGFNVSGEFDFNNGRIVAVIYTDTMTGNWYQDINKDGTYETKGTLIMKFSKDGNSFKGTWGYGESPSNGGLWNGTRLT
ncbi:hypothetical protein J2Z44_002398 [Clostridium punense]|uniref:MORN repeat protein n=2 Tax=Clostridium TaxID=1485 RepID=A0ABS4K5L7_9CLOT|nr:hypothetical protein [Clostridium punense]MBP2022575.1 hypothetical protein [Clostridium punense]